MDAFERLLDLGLALTTWSPTRERDRRLIMEAAAELRSLSRTCVTLIDLPYEPLRNVRRNLALWNAAA
ncbi:MAG TPA: hypothetical protein VM282_13990 [Acidimicrobiales bacterium]|nr:hypothetical protein [Acidimicrobiales bacterium]